MEFLPEIIVGTATAFVVALLAWLMRVLIRGLKTYLDDEIKSKLIPNGGSSIADRLTKLEKAVEKLTQISEDQSCPNPGCPQRTACAHMQAAQTRRGFLGLFG